ncbi:hypothetical protein EIP75_23620 [Aquabacterium soli]|uniref:Uncharacterized protein n=1 Tax=Aquabacterium soli TaxID=2493092 RepID=A0A426UZC1_9BURK|nr:hypothetical protein [Aquabacterium soli]RRR99900.1 hypothetical protein EIP75_23620 [Aquabacterium soli]
MADGTIEQIYPYVVPKSWVDHTTPDSLISWQVGRDVFIILVFDGQGSVRNVRPEDLGALGLDEGSAFEQAAQNLARAWQEQQFEFGAATLIDGTVIGCSRGNWMAPAGGLLLGNFHESLAAQFGQTELAAIAVNQDCLFAFPTDPKTLQSESLRIAINDEFSGHRKPISKTWLLLNGQWPQDHPLQSS